MLKQNMKKMNEVYKLSNIEIQKFFGDFIKNYPNSINYFYFYINKYEFSNIKDFIYLKIINIPGNNYHTNFKIIILLNEKNLKNFKHDYIDDSLKRILLKNYNYSGIAEYMKYTKHINIATIKINQNDFLKNIILQGINQQKYQEVGIYTDYFLRPNEELLTFFKLIENNYTIIN
jgi:hypothetical protein